MSRGALIPMGWTVGDGGGLGGRTARKSALGGLHTAHHDFATAHRELTILRLANRDRDRYEFGFTE